MVPKQQTESFKKWSARKQPLQGWPIFESSFKKTKTNELDYRAPPSLKNQESDEG